MLPPRRVLLHARRCEFRYSIRGVNVQFVTPTTMRTASSGDRDHRCATRQTTAAAERRSGGPVSTGKTGARHLPSSKIPMHKNSITSLLVAGLVLAGLSDVSTFKRRTDNPCSPPTKETLGRAEPWSNPKTDTENRTPTRSARFDLDARHRSTQNGRVTTRGFGARMFSMTKNRVGPGSRNARRSRLRRAEPADRRSTRS